MRQLKSEIELRELAELHSKNICVRTMDGGTSHDATRKATKRQHDTLYGIIYGALLALNWGEKNRDCRDIEQAVIDAAEFEADILMRPYMRNGEEFQGYMSVYIPLQRIVSRWERE